MIAPAQPMPRTRPQIVDGRDPARRDDGAAVEADEALVQGEIRAVEKAVAVDGGHLERLDADVGQPVDRVGGVDGPASPVASRDRRPRRRGRRSRRRCAPAPCDVDEATGEGRIPEGGGPDDDPRRSGLAGRRRRRRSSGGRRRPRPWVSPPTAATIAAITVPCAGTPVRAPSRSTTWIHRAPASANPTATSTGSSS